MVFPALKPPMASHCRQVKGKHLSLVFKAFFPVSLPTAPLNTLSALAPSILLSPLYFLQPGLYPTDLVSVGPNLPID